MILSYPHSENQEYINGLLTTLIKYMYTYVWELVTSIAFKLRTDFVVLNS